jgi:hypothetical protein
MRHQGERETHRLFRTRRYPRLHVGTGYEPGSEVKAFDRTYVVDRGNFRVLVYGENAESDVYIPNVSKKDMREAVEQVLADMMKQKEIGNAE